MRLGRALPALTGVILALAGAASAQSARDARLLVTVTDPSGAVVPKATVTVTALDDAARTTNFAPAQASDKGLATFDALLPGRYAIRAEFSGFEPGELKDVRVRSGDNKHVVVLALKKLQDAVNVSEDAQVAAASRRSSAFGSSLTQEEIAALSDDPLEMARQLQDMAGGNVVIKVDSFVAAALPPKAMIKSIHIVRDTFAAENHSAESDEIDIITQPGVGPLRGGGSSRTRDGSMSGQSPFTSTKAPEHSQTFEGNVGGSVIPEKASFSISASSRRSFDSPIVNVVLPTGSRSEVLDLHRPVDGWSMYGLFDYAVTRDQILRFAYDQSRSTRKNLGIGGYDLAERAYSTTSGDHEARVQQTGPFGRRGFINSRLAVDWADSESHSVLEAPTYRINDSGTRGGAQVAGGRHVRDFELASDLDYVRGIHSVRGGVLFEGGRYRTDEMQNYLGTYTFITTEAFSAGQAATYTRRIGDPLIEYWDVRSGLYLQDDLRLRKNLTVSLGLRYEAQTHVHDYGNVGPRAGMTWAPFKSGRTTLRASYGVFYQWLNSSVYETTLRVDGHRQQDLIVVNPPFPDPGTSGTVPAVNRYLLGSTLEMPRTLRLSAGIDQTLTRRIRVSFLYSNVRGVHVFRGLNLNAPVNGVRPDPRYANVIEVTSDGELHNQQLTTTLSLNLAPSGRAAAQSLWNWRRSNLRFAYYLARARNNTDGAFAVPPSGTLSTEWGPAPGDRRHRISASLTSQALRNLSANFTLAANTGTPYTITTGLDDNGDAIYNDRPAGTPRGTVRTASLWTLSANLSYGIPFGPRPAATVANPTGIGTGRYRLAFTLSATNVTNHSNYAGYSGVMTSPFFLAPTTVSNPRKIDIGMNFSF